MGDEGIRKELVGIIAMVVVTMIVVAVIYGLMKGVFS